MSMSLSELKFCYQQINEIALSINLGEDFAIPAIEIDNKLKGTTNANEYLVLVHEYCDILLKHISERVDSEFSKFNRISTVTESLKNKFWELLVNPIIFERYLAAPNSENIALSLIDEMFYSSPSYKRIIVHEYLQRRFQLLREADYYALNLEDKELIDRIVRRIRGSRSLKDAIEAMLDLMINGEKQLVIADIFIGYTQHVYEQITDVLSKLTKVAHDLFFENDEAYSNNIANYPIIKKLIDLYVSLNATNATSTQIQLLREALIVLATDVANRLDVIGVQAYIIELNNLQLAKLLAPLMFNAQHYALFIDNYLQKGAQYASTRVNSCMAQMLQNLKSTNHLVAQFIIVHTAKADIGELTEFLNLTLNKQISDFSATLAGLCDIYHLDNAITIEQNQDAADVVTHLKTSNDLELVAKLCPHYFSYQDFNEFLCLFIDRIRLKPDGKARIESRRTNTIVSETIVEIKHKNPSEIITKLGEAVTDLNNKKVKLNETLNYQIDYVIKKFNQLIGLMQQNFSFQLPTLLKQVHDFLIKCANVLPHEKDELLILANQIYFSTDHNEALTNPSLVETLEKLKNLIVNSKIETSFLVANQKNQLSTELDNLTAAIAAIANRPIAQNE